MKFARRLAPKVLAAAMFSSVAAGCWNIYQRATMDDLELIAVLVIGVPAAAAFMLWGMTRDRG